MDGIAESIDFLLKSGEGLAGLDSSQNLAFLNGVFRDNPRNIKTILCGSSLFQWASSHASSQAPQCTVHTEPPVSRDAKADVVHDEPNSLSHVFIGHGEPSTTDSDTPPPVATNPLHSYRQQLCAKMHCLYGVPIDDVVRDTASSSHYNLRYNSIAIHPYVRSRVYDLRQHTDGSLWGPFTDDGALEVDWEKLESIMIILNHNMKRYSTRYSEPGHDVPPWNEGFVGANPYSYFPELLDPSREPRAPLDSQDPYNVTGTWMRVVCFLDYTELYAFNFPEDQPPSHQPRPPLNTEEATRLINMKIKVTKIGPPGEDDGQDLPVVYFKGISSSLKPSWDANSNSSIRGWSNTLIVRYGTRLTLFLGTVRLTPKGEVRWTTMSVIHGLVNQKSTIYRHTEVLIGVLVSSDGAARVSR